MMNRVAALSEEPGKTLLQRCCRRGLADGQAHALIRSGRSSAPAQVLIQPKFCQPKIPPSGEACTRTTFPIDIGLPMVGGQADAIGPPSDRTDGRAVIIRWFRPTNITSETVLPG